MNALVPQMSAAERRELCLIVRRREKLEKTQAEQRSAELLANFEQQLATIYSWDDDAIWQAAEKEAEAVIEQAQAKIRSRCIELGIPKECRPSLDFGWAGRGQNASKERRDELRRVAKSRIEAIERTARTQIEKRSIEMQEEIMKDALTSDAARTLLTKMPTVASLMQPLDAKTLIGTVPLRESWQDR